jgi:hypothetical protein
MAACEMIACRFHDLRHMFRTQGAEKWLWSTELCPLCLSPIQAKKSFDAFDDDEGMDAQACSGRREVALPGSHLRAELSLRRARRSLDF